MHAWPIIREFSWGCPTKMLKLRIIIIIDTTNVIDLDYFVANHKIIVLITTSVTACA